MTQGWQGWDEYAPFYDWENARTVGRRDVRFWVDLARRQDGRVLELGCGTGRLSIPLLKSGADLFGVDRSAPMLSRARRKAARAGLRTRGRFVRGDIRALPFTRRPGFDLVMAPYGMLQSLTSERDLARTLDAVAGVLRRDGVFGIDLVPDLPRWSEYHERVTLSGRRADGRVTLRESVRQDRKRRLTCFDQEYVQRRNGRVERRQFSLVFRTLSIRQMRQRLEKAGLRVRAVLGDYQGGPWHERADVWVILAGKG